MASHAKASAAPSRWPPVKWTGCHLKSLYVLAFIHINEINRAANSVRVNKMFGLFLSNLEANCRPSSGATHCPFKHSIQAGGSSADARTYDKFTREVIKSFRATKSIDQSGSYLSTKSDFIIIVMFK